MSYTVEQRTREIGIRTALGANRGDVLKLVVGKGLKLALIGMVFGIIGAFELTRLLSSMLYGVTPRDPATFVAVSLLSRRRAGCQLHSRPPRRQSRSHGGAAL
jgi:ABC-type antimicrobial peptide transport system permease subunit